MSGQVTGWVLRYGPKDRAMRAVLITIADAANRDGSHAHPGVEAMIEGSGYCRSTVFAALKRLVEDGWLEVEHQERGPNAQVVYRVVMAAERVQPLDSLSERESRESPERVQRESNLSGLSTDGTPYLEFTGTGTRAADAANGLTREWWESHSPRPTQKFVAARKIVTTMLERFDEPTVRRALARAGPRVTEWHLDELCRGGRNGRGEPQTVDIAARMARGDL